MSLSNTAVHKGPAAAATTDFATFVQPLDGQGFVPKESRRKTGFSLARLQAEIQEVKSEAAEEGREEGYQEGYKFGHRVGMRDGASEALSEGRATCAREIEQFTRDLDEIGEAFQAAIQRWFQSVEQSLEEMAVVIAERVIAKELELSLEAISTLTKECLAEVTHATEARVRVNSAAYSVLAPHRELLQSLTPSLKHLEIIEDPSQTDGVIIDTDGGRIDGLIQTRLRSILRGISEAA
jgi:flagellar assembly protein FliH